MNNLEIQKKERIDWRFVLPTFLLAVFLIRYYNFFILYQPVRSFNPGGKYEHNLSDFISFNYTLKILYYIVKFIAISAILYAGIFLDGSKNKEQIVSFGRILILVLTAEFVFLTSEIIKIVDLTFISTNYDDQDYLNYYSLSLYSLLNVDSESAASILFQSINVYEFVYILCISLGLKNLQYADWSKSFRVTLYSYGSALVIWIIIMTYFKTI